MNLTPVENIETHAPYCSAEQQFLDKQHAYLSSSSSLYNQNFFTMNMCRYIFKNLFPQYTYVYTTSYAIYHLGGTFLSHFHSKFNLADLSPGVEKKIFKKIMRFDHDNHVFTQEHSIMTFTFLVESSSFLITLTLPRNTSFTFPTSELRSLGDGGGNAIYNLLSPYPTDDACIRNLLRVYLCPLVLEKNMLTHH